MLPHSGLLWFALRHATSPNTDQFQQSLITQWSPTSISKTTETCRTTNARCM